MILEGGRVDQLFKALSDSDTESAENSLFRRGLKKLQKPLESVKLAVDLAEPLLGLEPAVATASGAVKSFTAVRTLFDCGMKGNCSGAPGNRRSRKLRDYEHAE